ncbi:MAG: hypothetical protein ACFFCZ_22910 [Promethearchaeota archaeon]
MTLSQDNNSLNTVFLWLQKHSELIALVCLIILGWLIRVILAINSGGIIHPDEVYQSLEVAHKMKYGRGFIAWEFGIPSSPDQDGASRSYLFPLLFYVIFELCELGGIPYGTDGTLLVVKIFTATYTTLLIPIVFSVCKELFPSQDKTDIFSLFAAFLTTIGFPFLYFGVRTFTNSFVTVPIFLAIFLHLLATKKADEIISKRVIVLEFAAGTLLGFACALRMDSFIFFVPFFFLYHQNTRKMLYLYSALVCGFIGTFFIQGLSDLVYYGIFLISPINWVKYNIIEGKSSQYGTLPALYYVEQLINNSFYAVFFAIVIVILVIRVSYKLVHNREGKMEDPWFFTILKLLIWFLISLGIFSLVGHKEDRFIFSLYPIIMILFSAAIKECFEIIESSYIYLSTVLLSRFNTKLLTNQNRIRTIKMSFLLLCCLFIIQMNIISINNTNWTLHDYNNKALEWVGRQEDSTGVIFVGHWRDCGCWTYLHKNISLFYFGDHPDENEKWIHLPPSYNYLIAPHYQYELLEELREQITVNFTLVETIDNKADIWRLKELIVIKEAEENTQTHIQIFDLEEFVSTYTEKLRMGIHLAICLTN